MQSQQGLAQATSATGNLSPLSGNNANSVSLTLQSQSLISSEASSFDSISNASIISAAGTTPISAAPVQTTLLGPVLASTAASPFVINITWDSSVASAPAAFKTDVMDAVKYYESLFTNPVTINIDVGYDEIAGNTLEPGDLGESDAELNTVPYAKVLAALESHDTNATDASVLASLPATAPVSGSIVMSTAEEKALGLISATGTALDGYVGFGASSLFSYSDSVKVASGTYDFMGTVLHELSEDMGRSLLVGDEFSGTTPHYDLLDLLHYSASGVRDFTQSTAGYFSINGGVTDDGNYNTIAGGDAGDWSSSGATNEPDNSYDAYATPGTVDEITSNDLTLLNALGWNLAGAALADKPTGMMITPSTAAAGTTGLSANSTIALMNEANDYAWDNYQFTLGGAAASLFSLTVNDDRATLATGAAALAGAVNGKLYALTVTETDTTLGTHSGALPVDIVVGSSGTDIINLATLMGSGSTARAFVFGLGGNDTINGAGIAGKLWIEAGVGAETLTGGSAANTYVYGAASDSTPTAMDVITNFDTAADVINLVNLGTKLSYAGDITGTTLAANSFGWQVSGSNSFVDVNNTSASVSLGAVPMKIELNGILTLTAANFSHQ